MREAMIEADEKFEVRRAAMLWRKAGEIDAVTEEAIAELYADDRVRTTKVFRVLFFGFTWFGFSTALGLFASFVMAATGGSGQSDWFAGLYLVAGGVALAASEFLHGTRRLRRFGVEEALVWIGVTHVVGGLTWIVHRAIDPGDSWILLFAAWATAAVTLIAAWRWGTPGTGYVAAAALLVAVTQLAAAHLVWLSVSLLTVWPLAHLSLAEHISPQGRKRFREAFVVMSVAAYIALHVELIENQLFRYLHLGRADGFGAREPVADLWILASEVLMVLFPLALMGAGCARRYRPALDLGAVLLLVSLATFAFRARPQPEWLFLTGSGASLIALALLLRRSFARAAGSEWRGLTSRRLSDDPASPGALETLAVLTAFTPAARSIESSTGKGAGGEFGGGGASSRF